MATLLAECQREDATLSVLLNLLQTLIMNENEVNVDNGRAEALPIIVQRADSTCYQEQNWVQQRVGDRVSGRQTRRVPLALHTSCRKSACEQCLPTQYLSFNHGRPVCRARGGGKCPPPRFCEANVKALILTIGAPQIYILPSQFYLMSPPSFQSHRAPMLST